MQDKHVLSRRNFLVGAGAALFAGALAGCSAGQSASDSNAGNNGASSDNTVSSSANSNGASSGDKDLGRVLVAYYSAQGHTRAVAEAAADELGADNFEIVPTEPYSDDDLNWRNNDSRVTREHDDESQRDVELQTITPDNWADYDTVLLGYPIWWGIAAWPVNNFVTGNDFSDKTVIPFCTSSSSGIGQSGELLEQAAGTGDWQDGQRFSSGVSESDVRAWADGLKG